MRAAVGPCRSASTRPTRPPEPRERRRQTGGHQALAHPALAARDRDDVAHAGEPRAFTRCAAPSPGQAGRSGRRPVTSLYVRIRPIDPTSFAPPPDAGRTGGSRDRIPARGDDVRCVVMTAPREPLELRRFDAPRPEPGGAVARDVASEVCGTDVHLHHGRLAGVPYPIIPGHVSVGRVLETNGAARDVDGPGDRARAARHLLRRLRHLRRVLALPRGEGGHALPAPTRLRDHDERGGGAARRLGRAHRAQAGRAAAAAAGRPRRRGLHGRRLRPADGFHAVERAGIALGDTVVVQGSGPVGLNALVFAQLAGAAAGAGDGAPAARLAAARRLGAEDTLDVARCRDPASARAGSASARGDGGPTW